MKYYVEMSRGSYDDHTTWPIAFFNTEEEAREYCIKLTDKIDRIKKLAAELYDYGHDEFYGRGYDITELNAPDYYPLQKPYRV